MSDKPKRVRLSIDNGCFSVEYTRRYCDMSDYERERIAELMKILVGEGLEAAGDLKNTVVRDRN